MKHPRVKLAEGNAAVGVGVGQVEDLANTPGVRIVRGEEPQRKPLELLCAPVVCQSKRGTGVRAI